MLLTFILPILTQLVNAVFAIKMEWPPCKENSDCDRLTECKSQIAGLPRQRSCVSTIPNRCYVAGENQCPFLGDFECKENCEYYCERKCTANHIQCNSDKDCSRLFHCEDNVCLPASFEASFCYADENCNVFSYCQDLRCKINFRSKYTIASIAAGILVVTWIICCLIPYVYRYFTSGTLKSNGARSFC